MKDRKISYGDVVGILRAYKVFLRNKTDYDDEKCGYFCYWTKDYLHYLFKNGAENRETFYGASIKEYLTNKRKIKEIPAWLEKKVVDSINLFSFRFLEHYLRGFPFLAGMWINFLPKIDGGGHKDWESLLTSYREALVLRHYSKNTVGSYMRWIQDFRAFSIGVHPGKLITHHIRQWLHKLAQRDKVSSSTQNIAFCAAIFLYRYLLHRPVDDLSDALRAKPS